MAAIPVTSRRVTAIAALQAGIGAVLLARPALTAGLSAADTPVTPTWLTRLLGARMVVQAGVTLVRPTAGVALLGAAVDAVHGASMLAVAAGDRRRARPALASAALAGGFTAALVIAVRSGRR